MVSNQDPNTRNNMTSSKLVSPQKVVPSFTRTLLPDHNHIDRGIPTYGIGLIHLYGIGLTKRGQGLWVGYASCMMCDKFPRHASIVKITVPYTNWVMRINSKFIIIYACFTFGTLHISHCLLTCSILSFGFISVIVIFYSIY